MTDARKIEADPAWLPHRIDVAAGKVEFLRVERSALSMPEFLADRRPAAASQSAVLGMDEVAAMRPRTGPIHFLFHTAFCRSTLLVRALDIPGVSVGLSEPGIVASLVNAGQAGAPLVRPVLDLLSRPHAEGEVVFVKPTNHANMLMPAVLSARPDAKAVLMTSDLASFLAAVVRKGLPGRRWGRQLFIELQSYAGMDFGMDGRESFSMTDLQAAGLAWFLNQRWFAAHLSGRDGARLHVLHGDRFNAERARTLRAIARFAGVDLSQDGAKSVAGSSLFRQPC